jgi:hypothetical protein
VTAEAPAAEPDRGRRPDALAASVPDDNHILMRMLRMLIQPPPQYHWAAWMGVPLGGVIILIYVIAKWGVPAILAMQTLILQIHGDQIKLDMTDRDLQRQQVTATGELLDAVRGIADGQQQMTVTVQEQGKQIATLAQSVAAMQQAQARLAAQQAQLRERVNKAPPPSTPEPRNR